MSPYRLRLISWLIVPPLLALALAVATARRSAAQVQPPRINAGTPELRTAR